MSVHSRDSGLESLGVGSGSLCLVASATAAPAELLGTVGGSSIGFREFGASAESGSLPSKRPDSAGDPWATERIPQ